MNSFSTFLGQIDFCPKHDQRIPFIYLYYMYYLYHIFFELLISSTQLALLQFLYLYKVNPNSIFSESCSWN